MKCRTYGEPLRYIDLLTFVGLSSVPAMCSGGSQVGIVDLWLVRHFFKRETEKTYK